MFFLLLLPHVLLLLLHLHHALAVKLGKVGMVAHELRETIGVFDCLLTIGDVIDDTLKGWS
jgi:hypothetical protein